MAESRQLQLGETFTADGQELIVFEVSDNFAFVCPRTVGTLEEHLDTTKTMVVNRSTSGENEVSMAGIFSRAVDPKEEPQTV